MTPSKNFGKTLIVGIAGGSGSGKTTLAKLLQKKLGDEAELLGQDHYYIDQSAHFTGDGESVNFDHPDAIDFSLLAHHLRSLKFQKSVHVPRYDFKTHRRLSEGVLFEPKPVVIVDGILILSQPDVKKCLDFSVFIDAPEAVRFERRLKRDVTERGRTAEGVKKQFERQVKPMHDQFVEPSKALADLVVSGVGSIDEACAEVLNKIAELRRK